MKGWIIALCTLQSLFCGFGILCMVIALLIAKRSGANQDSLNNNILLMICLFIPVVIFGVAAVVKTGNRPSIVSNFLIGLPLLAIGIRGIGRLAQNTTASSTGIQTLIAYSVAALGLAMTISATLMILWRRKVRPIPSEIYFD